MGSPAGKLKFRIRGSGRALPQGPTHRRWSNVDLLRQNPETADKPDKVIQGLADRIESMYGVRTREMGHAPGSRDFLPGEPTSESLAIDACRRAMGSGSPAALILGSTTSRRYSGSQAIAVAGALGLQCPAWDLKGGCSTSLLSLHTAFALMSFGSPNVLVSAAETLSKIIHPTERETWFGLADGAAALWIERADGSGTGPTLELEVAHLESDGRYADLFTVPGEMPPRRSELEADRYFISGDSAALRAHALEKYRGMIESQLPRPEDRAFDWIIPHQVNRGLIDEVVSGTGLRGPITWDAREIGNIGGTSILYSLAGWMESAKPRPGQRLLLMSVGGGLSCALQVWRVV